METMDPQALPQDRPPATQPQAPPQGIPVSPPQTSLQSEPQTSPQNQDLNQPQALGQSQAEDAGSGPATPSLIYIGASSPLLTYSPERNSLGGGGWRLNDQGYSTLQSQGQSQGRGVYTISLAGLYCEFYPVHTSTLFSLQPAAHPPVWCNFTFD